MTEKTNETRQKTRKRINGLYKDRKFLVVIALVFVVAFVVLIFIFSGSKNHRSETYRDVQGAAGLDATISYDCGQKCDYDFNVYIFDKSGWQVSVVRPDGEGKVRLALPEGEYVMLIGERLAGGDLFPQEPLSLKNGKTLELDLQYKGRAQ